MFKCINLSEIIPQVSLLQRDGYGGSGSNHLAIMDKKEGKQGFFWSKDNLDNLKAV